MPLQGVLYLSVMRSLRHSLPRSYLIIQPKLNYEMCSRVLWSVGDNFRYGEIMQNLLQNISLFKGLDASCLDFIEYVGEKHSYASGEVLFHEGQKATGIHVLLCGVVKVVRVTTQGRELVLFLARTGNMVGEGAVFQSVHARHTTQNFATEVATAVATEAATAVATEAVQTLFISQQALFLSMEKHPLLALCMLKALATRQRMFMHKLAAQAERGAVRRVAAYICHRAFIEGGKNIIDLGVSREDLANLLGLARETVSRQLSYLLEMGVITVQGRMVYITDLNILQKMANDG